MDLAPAHYTSQATWVLGLTGTRNHVSGTMWDQGPSGPQGIWDLGVLEPMSLVLWNPRNSENSGPQRLAHHFFHLRSVAWRMYVPYHLPRSG